VPARVARDAIAAKSARTLDLFSSLDKPQDGPGYDVFNSTLIYGACQYRRNTCRGITAVDAKP
jgi:hypothetical protein